ncbi:MAG TPA: ATP synthase F0 subunit B [Candidatus Acidoferrales bacterium]|nr:ATP synthase F0 subunit B [Candidatus Acidoferrales bacterium]
MNYDEIAKWSNVVSAVVFMAVIVYLWLRFVQPAVVAAQAKSNEMIKEAERHRDEAKAAIDVLQRELEGARRDAELIRERAREQAQREADAIVTDAKTSGERAVHNAQGELGRARAAARVRLRAELADKALDLAREQAQQRVDGALNERLVQGFVASLERGGGN